MHRSLVDVNQSRDPDGLRCFYYLVQVIYSWTLIPQLFFYIYYAGFEVPGVLPHWPPFQDQANLNLKISHKRKGRPKEAAGIVPHRILQKNTRLVFHACKRQLGVYFSSNQTISDHVGLLPSCLYCWINEPPDG